MPNEEEVKEPEGTAPGEGGSGEDGDKKSGVKLVHKVYEDEDKNFVVYGLCCNIL